MGYKVLYIEKSEHLRLYLDNIKIESERGEILFPIKDVMTLIIDNEKTNLSLRLINKLTENNVCIILCGLDHLPQSYILPYNGNYTQSGNLFEQIKWKEEIKLKLHRKIIQGKISNQIDLLKKYRYNKELIAKLYQFESEVNYGDSTNREGLVAKMYFRALYGDDFIRFNNDVINAGLNYGYSILRSLITSVIISKGYLPNIGIFHRGKTNMFNLSDDIIEVFRPIIDDWVYRNLKDEMFFKAEHREALIQITTTRIYFDHKSQTLNNAIHNYIESILKCIEYDDDNYFINPVVIME